MRCRTLLLAHSGVAAALGLLGCASAALPEGEGASLYRAKCSGCHRLYAPGEIDPLTWGPTLERMRTNHVSLTDEEIAALDRYVRSNLPKSGQ